MLKSTHQTPLNSIVLVFSVTRLPVKLSILAMPSIREELTLGILF